MATDKSVMAVIRASRPSFRNNYDKVAFAVHASFLASGFVLTATGPPAFSDSSLSSSSTGNHYPLLHSQFYCTIILFFWSLNGFWVCFAVEDEVGIDGWNEVDGEYAFVYANPEKSFKKVLVKCLVMNDKLLVDALADGSSEPVHLEIKYDFLLILLFWHLGKI